MTFFSRLPQITETTLKQAFQVVMKNTTQAAYIASGEVGKLDFQGIEVVVYGNENAWNVQAMVGARVAAANTYTNRDI